jgi:REP element-mobilizing transposase RayT
VEPEEYARWRNAARQALHFPPVTLTGRQALAVAQGFGQFVRKSGLGIWSCSILPEHVHLVLARHRYNIEQAANLLKGEATRRLLEKNLHPMKRFQRSKRDRLPSLWGENQWKVFLDCEEAIENAIRYVEENPERENKLRQQWSFVTPFAGLEQSGWITYP